MSASTQLKCGGQVCSQCGKCRDWEPTDSFKRHDNATCRDNAETLFSALFGAATAASDARRSYRISTNTPRDHATNRCRRAADRLQTTYNASILDEQLDDRVAEALTRIEFIAYDIDRAADGDGPFISGIAAVVRRAHRAHICQCK